MNWSNPASTAFCQEPQQTSPPLLGFTLSKEERVWSDENKTAECREGHSFWEKPTYGGEQLPQATGAQVIDLPQTM